SIRFRLCASAYRLCSRPGNSALVISVVNARGAYSPASQHIRTCRWTHRLPLLLDYFLECLRTSKDGRLSEAALKNYPMRLRRILQSSVDRSSREQRSSPCKNCRQLEPSFWI